MESTRRFQELIVHIDPDYIGAEALQASRDVAEPTSEIQDPFARVQGHASERVVPAAPTLLTFILLDEAHGITRANPVALRGIGNINALRRAVARPWAPSP